MKWKESARYYRELSKNLVAVLEEEIHSTNEIIDAAIKFRKISSIKFNPMVPVIGGESIQVQRAKRQLFEALDKAGYTNL